MAWDRLLWGIEFKGSDGKPVLLGKLWATDWRVAYHGEPTRALLFTTRAQARRWCADKMAEWRSGDEVLSKWKVRPVRVREIVSVEG